MLCENSVGIPSLTPYDLHKAHHNKQNKSTQHSLYTYLRFDAPSNPPVPKVGHFLQGSCVSIYIHTSIGRGSQKLAISSLISRYLCVNDIIMQT